MTGFTSPNHTQCPNDLFDVHMLDMKEAELKVTLAIIRKTLGFHKKSDPISLTQLQKLTGLSRQAVSDGTASAIKRGVIQVVGTGKRGVIIYGLVINSDQSIEVTNVPLNQSKILDSTSLQSRHTKETTTKEIKKVRTPKVVKPLHTKNAEAIVNAWGRARGFAALDLGAPIGSDDDWKCAEEMAQWERPPTEDEIKRCLKQSTAYNYPVRFLKKDVVELRAKNAKKIISHNPELNTAVEFVPILLQHARKEDAS